MATTGVNSNLKPTYWEKELDEVFYGTLWAKSFMGKNNAVVHIKDQIKQKTPGERIRFGIPFQLSGTGRTGKQALKGYEEQLNVYDDSVTIDILRHAVSLTGFIDDYEVVYDRVDEVTNALTHWMSEKIDKIIFAHLAGDTSFTPAIPATPLAPSSNRVNKATSSVTSSDTLSIQVISKYSRALRVSPTDYSRPRIKPVIVNGKRVFVLFAHPHLIYDLTRDSEYVQKGLEGLQRSSDHPLINGVFGAIGYWEGVLIYETEHLPVATDWGSGSNLNGSRAILCGDSGAVFADVTGIKMKYEYDDYEFQRGISIYKIFGVKKVRYNSEDYGVYGLNLYRTITTTA